MQVDRVVIYWTSKSNYEYALCICGTEDAIGLIYTIISWGFLTEKPM